MRCPIHWWAVPCVLALFLAGCTGSAQGPRAWIDRPLDGDRIALEEQQLLAHASGSTGIDHFAFYVNDLPLRDVPASGWQFAEGSVAWLPTAPGAYTIAVKAFDSRGDSGPAATVQVIVEGTPTLPPSQPLVQPTASPTPSPAPLVQPTLSPTPAPAQPATSPTPTPAPAQPATSPTPTPTPAPALPSPTHTPFPLLPAPASPSPTPPDAPDVRLWADQDTVQAGSCMLVRWHVTGVSAYWVDGTAGAGDDGIMQVCPCAEEVHTLHAIRADGDAQDVSVRIAVEGQCAAPPQDVDGSGPTIEVRLEAQGSSDTGCRTLARAVVSDPSGVGWVRFHFALDGDGWNTIDLSHTGGAEYGALVPGAAGSGNIEFRAEAGDTLGNVAATAPRSESLPACGPG